MQIMAVRILRRKKSRIVALTLEKTHWKNWWFVVVHHTNSARKHAHPRFIIGKFKVKFGPTDKEDTPCVGGN